MNGVVVVDKPAGMTSAQVVSRVKRQTRVSKAGHTGTLDPLATGVLPVCLGEGTKIAEYLLCSDKAYEGELLLGVETDTLDREGVVVASNEKAVSQVTEDRVREGMNTLTGAIQQVPPMFSAIHHQGQRLHQLARRGEFVQRKPRPVTVHAFDLLEMRLPILRFSVHCSRGTYVRVLGHDLGLFLKTGASLQSLRRTQSGRYQVGQAVELEQIGPNTAVDDPATALGHLPGTRVPDRLHRDLRDGKPLKWNAICPDLAPAGPVRLMSERGALLALVEIVSNNIRYHRVFTYGLTCGPES